MINLNEISKENDNTNEEIVIFNGGNAGRVKNVRVEVKRKTPEDKPNSPDYKIFYVDDEGGKVNDGIYYPKEEDKNPKFKLTRLVNLLHSINPSLVGKELPEFEDYVSATDFLIKQIIASSKTGRVNVFVNYGTKGYPSQYLNVRKINFVEPVTASDNTTRLKPAINKDESKSQYDDLMSRIEETNFDDGSFENVGPDLSDQTSELPSNDEIDW